MGIGFSFLIIYALECFGWYKLFFWLIYDLIGLIINWGWFLDVEVIPLLY